jgi:twitching motility protein PilT
VDLARDIIWSDLCVCADPADAWYKATPDAMKVMGLEAEVRPAAKELWDRLEAMWQERGEPLSKHGFTLMLNGMRLRAKRIPLANGMHVYVCRAFRFAPARLDDIGLNTAVAARLMSPTLRNGIGIILGRPGSGKTTTACAYIAERARQLGGVTWTIENPVEIEMEGRYGDGYIHQRELDTPDQMSEAIRDLARATPNVMFVGEVLDDGTAEAVVQASKAGYFVLCTYHGNDLINGIERFARSAGHGQISEQFVEAFRFAIHLDLRLVDDKDKSKSLDNMFSGMQTGTPPRVLYARPFFCMEDQDPNRSFMRNGEFAKLSSGIEKQKNELFREMAAAQRERQPAMAGRV